MQKMIYKIRSFNVINVGVAIPGKFHKVDESIFWAILWSKIFEMTKTESSRGNENDYHDNFQFAKNKLNSDPTGLAVLDIHFQIIDNKTKNA